MQACTVAIGGATSGTCAQTGPWRPQTVRWWWLPPIRVCRVSMKHPASGSWWSRVSQMPLQKGELRSSLDWAFEGLPVGEVSHEAIWALGTPWHKSPMAHLAVPTSAKHHTVSEKQNSEGFAAGRTHGRRMSKSFSDVNQECSEQ